jgi:cysteine desulfurase
MPIYLDYNATAPLKPAARAAMLEWLEVPANPSSVHSFGRAAKKQLEDARKAIAESISAWPNEIVFMASGTEANSTALRAFPGRTIITSAIEHSSVLKYAARSESGAPLTIPVNADGVIELSALASLLQATPNALVSVMLANNETGAIQPIQDVAALCKTHGALLHVDAVQALGKIALDFSLLGADMLSISAHKCGGPLGAAALVVRNDLALSPLLIGGGQELGRRAGTENIAAIAGFAAAVTDNAPLPLRAWLDELESAVLAAGGMVASHKAARLPNTSCIIMPGVEGSIQLMDCDMAGFAISAGSACSSGRIETSHVLLAMGMARELAASAIRISLGWGSTQADVQRFTKHWGKLSSRLQKRSA